MVMTMNDPGLGAKFTLLANMIQTANVEIYVQIRNCTKQIYLDIAGESLFDIRLIHHSKIDRNPLSCRDNCKPVNNKR